MTLHRRWGRLRAHDDAGLGISDPVAGPKRAAHTVAARGAPDAARPYVAANPGAALIVGVVNGEKVTIYRAYDAVRTETSGRNIKSARSPQNVHPRRCSR